MTAAKPSRYASPGGELPLSGVGQVELVRAMMERGSPLRIRAFGFSMTPLIQDGDVVTIAPLAGQPPVVGEVVAFLLPGTEKLALHRVVGREETGWLLRGDNCRESDGVVVGDQILGRITRVERSGRDVPFGSGLAGAGLAWLSRSGSLIGLRALRRALRRVASFGLRHAQGCALYRAAGRRLAPHFVITEATDSDVRWAERRRGLDEPGSRPTRVNGLAASGWVAKRDDRVIGFVQLGGIHGDDPPLKGLWLSSLVVRESYRGLGIGAALAKRALEEAGSRGVSNLFLELPEGDDVAAGLCRKLGFEPVTADALEALVTAGEHVVDPKRIILGKRVGDGAART